MFQIEPFASLVNTVRSTVPRLLLNRHAVGPFEKVPLRRGDHMELGNLEDTVRKFAEMLGWNNEIEELMRNQETLVGSKSSHRSYMSQLKRKKAAEWLLHSPVALSGFHFFLQTIPALASSPPSQTCPIRATAEPQGRTETSRSIPGAQRAAGSGGEETDSETDSKSSASSTLSN